MSNNQVEPVRKAFDAVGHTYECILKEQGRDEAYFRRRITESIRAEGRPVLAFGIIGPPECCIITGYDDYGDVLIGWNFFQGIPEMGGGEQEPSGYFRKRNWFNDFFGLIIIGEKKEKPPRGEIYRKTLTWAIEIARTPMVHGRHSGLAAYTAWSEHLLRDEDFANRT